MTMLIYAAFSIAFLVLVISLLRKPHAAEPDECLKKEGYSAAIESNRWLDLSERIFDPSDARWLADELAFPKLADSLTLSRKRLAIQWLESLQSSFDELVRTPDLPSDGAANAMQTDGWKLLWLALRFKVLVYYALIVVKVFGPYHRLLPSFAWVPRAPENEHGFRRVALAATRISR